MRKVLNVVTALSIFLNILIGFSFAEKVEHPWEKFNVGSWVLYELSGGMQQRQTLINKTEKELILKMEMIKDEQVIYSGENKMPLEMTPQEKTADNIKANMKESEDKLEIKKENVLCKVYEVTSELGTTKSWMSDRIPGGVVQTMVEGNIAMKILDYEAK